MVAFAASFARGIGGGCLLVFLFTPCRQRKILSSRTQRFNLTFSGQGITLLGAVVRAQICTDLTDFGVNR